MCPVCVCTCVRESERRGGTTKLISGPLYYLSPVYDLQCLVCLSEVKLAFSQKMISEAHLVHRSVS